MDDDVCRMSKRATPSAAAAAAGDVDLISGLGDDVLVHILELLPDAGDAVRTGALSRRWRGLWTRLPALHFASTSRPAFSAGVGGAQRFASFVRNAIPLRAAETDPAVQHLAISFVAPPHKHRLQPRPSIVRAAQRCIRDAVRHDVRSLTVELRNARREEHGHHRRRHALEQQLLAVKILNGLPRSEKMESMRLALGGAAVSLPAAARAPAFASLADLTLEGMEFAVDSGRLLTHLLSSACCPRLQKLRLRDLAFPSSIPDWERLLEVEAEALLELSWEEIQQPEKLRLRTPRLRVLRMMRCDIRELTISAPRLEEIFFLDASQSYSKIHIDGELPCVRRLRVKLIPHVHGYSSDDSDDDDDVYGEVLNGTTVCLLRCCKAVECLDVDLYVSQKGYHSVNIIKGKIPQLPQVTSLTVHVYLFELHSIGSGMAADILAQCSNLKYLRICCTFKMGNDLKSLPFLCVHHDNWESGVFYCLPHLKEVEFKGLAGTECELWFVQSILASTTQLFKVTISFDQKSSLENRIHAFERITPLQEHGMWTCCHEPYLSWEWKPSL